ncbi:S8 family serine peptidase [Flavobacterium paronense]|uniref:S8 family serine peptidase n=1 Tax=Flavobacterium paronense TaxID=1392775 RepID=A0ABV5GDI4_9FLAO|nr:S8 family serine peptidase [Flavobacterium paronense]MDN3677985.1 S8 family serine peptidase [Flavobacterium paronense]
MKTLFALLFFPFFVFSQTIAERQKIAASNNQTEIARLKKSNEEFSIVQQKRIDDYKKQHPFVDSEKMSLQRIEDDGTPIFYTIYNQGSSVTLGTNKMYPGGSLGLSVTGTGMTAGVWDGGKVRDTHQEFVGGKVTLSDAAATLSSHSTHVTGTIMASGFSPLRKGIAYGAQAKTYDWTSDYSEFLAFGAAGYLASNHSYGYIASSLSDAKFGQYDASSIQIDNAAYANPYYQICVAAGNDRDDFTIAQVGNKGGYDLLTGFATSKNSLVVAAVNEVSNYTSESSVVMSSFSNYGPTDDGRIKPDISAKGVGVSSCVSSGNASYDTYQGTSMATPAITGMILLLQKHYNNLNPSTYMRASTVRGLICHSAKEAGLYPGPDYEFGWGLANAELAANIITNRNVSTVLEENTLNVGQTFTKQISIASTQKLSATICWTDPQGTSNNANDIDNRAARLKNNLDLKILKDGTIYYPWKLYVEDPTSPAINTEENDVDNVEKVEIVDAQPGIYTIQVTHKGTLTGGSQVFSLIANATNQLSLNTRDYDFDTSIFIYPNPAASVLNFIVKNNTTVSDITINDISGKQIYKSVNAINNSIDVSSLSSGVYFVTFKSDNNSVTKKFIKE